jgi:hypothetical protein
MTNAHNSESTTPSASGIAAALTWIGILTFALFPLAIPLLILTAVFTAPLALLGVLAVVPVGIVAGLVLAGRRIARRLRGRTYRPRARAAPDVV